MGSGVAAAENSQNSYSDQFQWLLYNTFPRYGLQQNCSINIVRWQPEYDGLGVAMQKKNETLGGNGVRIEPSGLRVEFDGDAGSALK